MLVQISNILCAVSLVILQARRGKLLRELRNLGLNLRIVRQVAELADIRCLGPLVIWAVLMIQHGVDSLANAPAQDCGDNDQDRQRREEDDDSRDTNV